MTKADKGFCLTSMSFVHNMRALLLPLSPTRRESGTSWRGVDPTQVDPTQNLIKALKTNSYTRIKTTLSAPGIDFGYRDPELQDRTILMRLCYLDIGAKNRRDLVKILLRGTDPEFFESPPDLDVNARDADGKTALAHACIVGDAALVKLLAKEYDLDPNLADLEGNSPLMHACRAGRLHVVSTLLANFVKLGLRVDEPNSQGVTPLIEAAKCGHAEVCRRLVTIGNADVNARDSHSFNTAQDYAIAERRLSTPDILLLSPVAQRKLQARRKREAMGRSSLAELMRRSSFCPAEELQRKDTKGSFILEQASQRKVPSSELQVEHLQQLNSALFRIAKYGLSRVAERRLEEDQEDTTANNHQDDNMSLSLPDLRAVSSLSDSASKSPCDGSPSIKPRNKLLRVACRRSLSMSPALSRKSAPIPSRPQTPSTSGKPSAPYPPPTKLPSVNSQNRDLAIFRRRASYPNTYFPSPSKPLTKTQGSPRLSKTPPNNSRSPIPSRKITNRSQTALGIAASESLESRTRLSWEGKPSSAVPSYLFR